MDFEKELEDLQMIYDRDCFKTPSEKELGLKDFILEKLSKAYQKGREDRGKELLEVIGNKKTEGETEDEKVGFSKGLDWIYKKLSQ